MSGVLGDNRRGVRTTGLCAIALLALIAGRCFPWASTDAVEIRGSLAEDFAVRVPPGYEGKYASRMDTGHWRWGFAVVAPQEISREEIAEAPRDHTVFFFGEAHFYPVLTAEWEKQVESDLYSRLRPEGYLPPAGERIREATVEFTVAERRVEGLRIEEASPLGRLVRYRVPVGSLRILVALGPADRFDEDALRSILASVHRRGRPMTKLGKVILAGMLIALALYAGLRIRRSFR